MDSSLKKSLLSLVSLLQADFLPPQGKKIVKQKKKLNLEELEENHPLVFTTTLFNLMDKDGDKNVSFEEFKLFWIKMKVGAVIL